MSGEFEVQGMEELMKKLEQMGKAGAKIENKALQKAAEPLLEEVKNTTVFNDVTGNLRKSIKMSRVKVAKDGKYIWIGDVDRKANYSWYVEFGSSKVPARPFLRTVFEAGKFKVFNTIKEEIEKGLKGK